MSNNMWKDPINVFSDKPQSLTEQEPAAPTTPPRKFNVGNDKDRREMWQLTKLKAMNDHKAELNYQSHSPSQRESNVTQDENGQVGVKESIMCGTKATGKHQADFLKALRAEIYAKHGIK